MLFVVFVITIDSIPLILNFLEKSCVRLYNSHQCSTRVVMNVHVTRVQDPTSTKRI